MGTVLLISFLFYFFLLAEIATVIPILEASETLRVDLETILATNNVLAAQRHSEAEEAEKADTAATALHTQAKLVAATERVCPVVNGLVLWWMGMPCGVTLAPWCVLGVFTKNSCLTPLG